MCVSILCGCGIADADDLCLVKFAARRSNVWLAINPISGYIGDTSCHVLAACKSRGFSLSLVVDLMVKWRVGSHQENV